MRAYGEDRNPEMGEKSYGARILPGTIANPCLSRGRLHVADIGRNFPVTAGVDAVSDG
jgi:hypothetical protein